jgi:hypothetical protein
MAEDISISGQVRGYNGTPIYMIRVTVYRDYEVAHEYTSEDGKYRISVPQGAPITVRFDTHYSLTNAREWHPSVVADVNAKQDILLDWFLLQVGMGESDAAAIDALAAYQFSAVWNAQDSNREYAEHAAARLGMLKVPSVLGSIYDKMRDHFTEQAQPH